MDADLVCKGELTEWQSFELDMPCELVELPIMAAIPEKDSIYIFCGDKGYMVDVNEMQAVEVQEHKDKNGWQSTYKGQSFITKKQEVLSFFYTCNRSQDTAYLLTYCSGKVNNQKRISVKVIDKMV